MGVVRFRQSRDQAIPHILRGVIIELAWVEHLCVQCRPLDLRGDGILVAEQLPEVGKLRIFHILQPVDVSDQALLLFFDVFRRPGQHRFSFLLTLAFPTQSVIAQGTPAAGASVFQLHDLWLR